MTDPTKPTELAGDREIETALEGILGLAARGIAPGDFLRYIGIDPEAVYRYAKEAAEEEFRTLPGMPPGIDATGRLRKLNLSASQRKQVKDALEESTVLALEVGAVLIHARHRGEDPGQEGDEPNGS